MKSDIPRIKYEGPVVVGAPGREIPAPVLAGIRDYCAGHPVIEELYLYVMALLNDDAPEGPQLAIGLRLGEKLSSRKERALCDGLSPAAPPPNSGYAGLVVGVLRNDEEVQSVRQHVAPLYRRGEPTNAWILKRMLSLPQTEGTDLSREPGSNRASGIVEFPIHNHAGFRSVPVFTSEEEFVRWRPEGGEWIALPAHAVLEAFIEMPADRIIVDNMGQQAFTIDRDQARALLEFAATLPPDTPSTT